MKFSKKSGKTEYMAIGGGKSKNIKMVTSTVKDGRIERVKEHKVLGTWFDETGEYSINISKRKEKLKFMITTTKNQGNPKKVGQFAVESRLKLAQIIVVQSLINHAEAFPNYTEKDIKQLESIQLQILTGILEIPSTTPYCALLMETGWWSMRARLAYKKLMLYHNIRHSDERRVVKKLLQQQQEEERETTWQGSIIKIKKKYDIQLDVDVTLKSTWKKYVKKKITEAEEKSIRDMCRNKKKARTVMNDEYVRKEYLGNATLKDVSKIIKSRLHMCKVPGNFKQKGVTMCPLCGEEEGSTEHYFDCKRTKYLVQIWEVKKEDLQSLETNKLKRVAKFIDKIEEMLQPILYP